MKAFYRIRFALPLLLLLLVTAACHRGPKILDKSEFADLYADMLLADEWVRLHPETRRDADTMLVYAEAFKRHGVSPSDVKANLEYYLQDPLRYSRSMELTLKRLESHEKIVREELDSKSDLTQFRVQFRKGAKFETVWHPIYPDPGYIDSVALRVPGLDTAYWQRRDSVLRVFPALMFQPSDVPDAKAFLARRDSL